MSLIKFHSRKIRMKINKKILALLALLLVLIGAGVKWYQSKHSDTAAVYHGNVDIRQVSLAFNGSDRVKDILVQEGEAVEAGQILARLDTTTLNLQLMQAKAQLAVQQQSLQRLKNGSRPEEINQAKANLNAAQADAQYATQQFQRMQSVHASTDQNAVSKSDLEAARARYQSAQAKAIVAQNNYRLTQAGPRKEDIDAAAAQTDAGKAQVALLEQRLKDAELKAPIAGVVRSRLIEVGDMVSPQKAAFTIALTQPKWIRIYIPETDLSRIHPGGVMNVQIDGLKDSLSGTVGYISSVAEFTPKTVQTQELRTSLVYEVRVQVDDPNNVLRLGMPATVTLGETH